MLLRIHCGPPTYRTCSLPVELSPHHGLLKKRTLRYHKALLSRGNFQHFMVPWALEITPKQLLGVASDHYKVKFWYEAQYNPNKMSLWCTELSYWSIIILSLYYLVSLAWWNYLISIIFLFQHCFGITLGRSQLLLLAMSGILLMVLRGAYMVPFASLVSKNVSCVPELLYYLFSWVFRNFFLKLK